MSPGTPTDPAPAGRPSPTPREPGTYRMGRIAGVDVFVRASWLLVALLLSVMLAGSVDAMVPGLGPLRYLAGFAFAVLLYLSVLLHELSHALMAKRFGLPVRSVTLHFLGGVTHIDSEPDTPKREFAVSVVGPLTSLAVGGVALLVGSLAPGPLLSWAFLWLGGANLIVGVFNLVPGLPLDGGRVLRAAVWKVTGSPHRGTVVAGWGGRVTALLVLAFPFLLPVVFGRPADLFDYLIAFVVATFLWGGATAAITSARIRRRLPALRAQALARRAVSVPEDLPLAEAVRRAREASAGGIVLVDRGGRPTAVVNEAALLATPEERRPWVPASTVARTLDPGLVLPAAAEGEDLVRAMQRTPATEYVLVRPDGSVHGVLVTADVDRAFAAQRG